MKLLLAAMMLAPVVAGAGEAVPDAALGTWKTETHAGVVEITRCGTSICGRLLTSAKLAAEPDLRDSRNTDVALRARKLGGLVLLQDFTWTPQGWVRGQIYNPDDGKTYHARVTALDQDHLRVRGCVFVPLCQSQIWVRVK